MFPPGTQVRSKSNDWTNGLVGEVVGLFNSGMSTVRFVGAVRGHNYGHIAGHDNREHWFIMDHYLEPMGGPW